MISLTQMDGLPSNTVYDIYQDDEGFMWFATEKGVSRYNGLKFQNYTIEDGLPGNVCFYFRKDRKGRLWVGNSTGKLVFYKDGVWHTEKNTPWLRLPFAGGLMHNIVEEKDSSITITFQAKNIFANLKNDSITSYNIFDSSYQDEYNIPKHTRSLVNIRYVDPFHYKLVFLNYDLVIDTRFRILKRTPHDSISQLKVSSGTEYYVTPKKILTSDYKHVLTLPERFDPGVQINRVFEHGKEVFLCTSKGILLNNDTLFKNINVTAVFVDKSGCYWVSTAGNGIHKLSAYFLTTETHLSSYDSKVNFSHCAKGTLLFSTQNRNIFRLRNNSVEKLLDFNRIFKFACTVNIGHMVMEDAYYNFNEKNIVVMNEIFSSKPTLYSSALKPESFTMNAMFITDSYVVIKGRAQVLYSSILASNFHKKLNTLTYSILQPEENKRDLNLIFGGNTDLLNHFWFSGVDGTYKMLGNRAVFQPQLGTHSFTEIIFLKNFLFGITAENRLFVFKNYDDRYCSIDSSIKQNCLWEKFYRIDENTLLISTNDYYRILRLDDKEQKGYSIRILENQFAPLLADYIYANDSLCYFFKDQSIFIFRSNDLIKSDSLPTTHFTYLKTTARTISDPKFIQLSYNESRSITIQYEVLSLSSNKLNYQYSISSDTTVLPRWQEAAAESINLTNIGYGTYFIRVRVRTYGGSYSDIKMLRLTIGKPYWVQWWFIGSILLTVVLIALAITFYLIRRKARQKEKEIRFLKSEFTALNALMNPHFVFNSLNSVQSLINKDDKQSASEYIRTISDLLRQNMYNLANELVSLEDEMMLVKNYLKLEKLRFKEKLNYTIHIHPSVDVEMIEVPPLFIQPLVENAIKYGVWKADRLDGTVAICIYPIDRGVAIDIIDNGLGLQESQNEEKHRSTAIINIQKRLQQLSLIHKKSFTLSIDNMTDEAGRIRGAKASIVISEQQ